MPLRFTFRQLEYLVAVGEAGTIAAAATRVNVSSPSISAAISQLEAEFGAQLFVRNHAQGLTLTPGGRNVFEKARAILQDAAALNEIAGDQATQIRGTVAVGVLSTLAPFISASLKRSYETENVGTQVVLHSGNQAQLLRMLGKAEIDIALTYDLDIPGDVIFEGLADLRPYILLPHDHPLSARKAVFLRELKTEPLVLLDLPLSREYFLSLFPSDAKPVISERAQQMSTLRSLVAGGFGFGIANVGRGVDCAPDGGRLANLTLADDMRPMVFGTATKRAEYRTRILASFMDHVRQRTDAGNLPGMQPEPSE